jgi:hypothetical protein
MATSQPQPVASLPFRFDTAGVVTSIVRGIGALFCVLAVGVLYLTFVRRNMASAGGLLIVSAGVVLLARVVLGNLAGTRGIITRDAVVLQRGSVFWMRTAGPTGTFELRRFKQVRVDRVLPSADTSSHGHERVVLVGNEGTPEILLARSDLDAGRVLGRDLAAALELPFDERLAPY